MMKRFMILPFTQAWIWLQQQGQMELQKYLAWIQN